MSIEEKIKIGLVGFLEGEGYMDILFRVLSERKYDDPESLERAWDAGPRSKEFEDLYDLLMDDMREYGYYPENIGEDFYASLIEGDQLTQKEIMQNSVVSTEIGNKEAIINFVNSIVSIIFRDVIWQYIKKTMNSNYDV